VTKALVLFCAVCVLFFGCARKESPNDSRVIRPVATVEQVTSVMDSSEHRLIAFDFYAPWCGPCRILAPLLETIAQENREQITFYRINIDNVPQAVQLFKVGRIPFVAFVKNKKVVAELAGIQPREQYMNIIAANSAAPAKQ
jgi:thioredoxin